MSLTHKARAFVVYFDTQYLASIITRMMMMGISDKTFDRGTQGEADCQYTNHSGIRWVRVKQAKCEQRYYA